MIKNHVAIPSPDIRSITAVLVDGELFQRLLASPETTVEANGHFYAVDFGPGVRPQHHRVRDGICSCYLGEECPAVDVVQRYLDAGGQVVAALPFGCYPVIPVHCPICKSPVAYDERLNSKSRGLGWRCTKGGSGHYWQRMGEILAVKFAANPWLFPPVVIRDGKQLNAYDGVLDGDTVLYPGVRRSEIVD
jgi:hypothetical protein